VTCIWTEEQTNEHRVLVEKLLQRPEMKWRNEMNIRERAYEDGDDWGELNQQI
jgi:hypothetical protein